MTPQEIFYETLNRVIGEVLTAAHYTLFENPMQQARGMFRYHKKLADDRYGFIEFQMLYHPDLSRFRISLLRNSSLDARTAAPDAVEHALAWIIWHEYQARVLSSEDHWWVYHHPQDLAAALVEAGKLLFGYGVPWLEGY